MNRTALSVLIAVFISFSIISSVKASDEGKGKRSSLRKAHGLYPHAILNVNNISTYFYNNGESDINLQGNSGLEYPKGSGKAVMFMSGFCWAGKVKNEVRANGTIYNSGLLPGRILPDGKPEDPAGARIYRVKKNYKLDDLASERKCGEGAEEEIRKKYEKDWNEWPAEFGAPYEDINKDGKYSPETDIPGVPGADQTIWFAANDLDETLSLNFLGSKPIGIEMQVTVWAYKNFGSLSNMFFRKHTLINKSRSQIDSMYIMMWGDPDLGNAADDFVGCDTLLSLGYCYNGGPYDLAYGDYPPAVGFCLLQGPVVKSVPTDTAVSMGRKTAGMKNLPMTSFSYLFKSYSYWGDVVLGSYNNGTLRLYNYMQGKDRLGREFPVPLELGGGTTKFPFSGDPAAGTGFLNGLVDNPSDHRMGVSSGPFTMAPGDTQEVIIAEITAGGPGSTLDYLNSVTRLKEITRPLFYFNDGPFLLPQAPPRPKIEASELDREIILNWGTDQACVEATESHNSKGFAFEGYNVYQLSSPYSSKKDAVRIAVFDRINEVKYIIGNAVDSASGLILKEVQQFGSDRGIERYINIKRDYLTNLPLVNGKKYYYAVTSYSYASASVLEKNNIENSLDIITVIPHSPDPGVRYTTAIGDTLMVNKLSGNSDGTVVALVVDPKAVTGHEYRIEFMPYNDSYCWKLTDVSDNEIKINSQLNQSGNNDYLIADGIMVKVIGPQAGIKSDDIFSKPRDKSSWGWDVPGGQETRRWTWAYANVSGYTLEAFGANVHSPEYGDAVSSGLWWGTSLTSEKFKNVLLKFAPTDTAGNVSNIDDPNISYAYRYMRSCQNQPAKAEFGQFIINNIASYDFQDFKKNFPFAAYDMEANPPRRLAVGFLENNVEAGLVDGRYWPLNSNYASKAEGNSSVNSPREWFFIFDSEYKETVEPLLARNFNNPDNPLPLMYLGMPNRKGNSCFSAGDEFAIYPNHINTDLDKWTFTAPGVSASAELAKLDVDKINVFPNPYYGANRQELNKFQKFVTFNHLPQKATIRIFNLAGELVRTLRKNSPGQFAQWDLLTESNFQAGSGLYIVHIDMPELGRTKILKLAIIQELIIPDYY